MTTATCKAISNNQAKFQEREKNNTAGSLQKGTSCFSSVRDQIETVQTLNVILFVKHTWKTLSNF